jgi:hypothetical protein
MQNRHLHGGKCVTNLAGRAHGRDGVRFEAVRRAGVVGRDGAAGGAAVAPQRVVLLERHAPSNVLGNGIDAARAVEVAQQRRILTRVQVLGGNLFEHSLQCDTSFIVTPTKDRTGRRSYQIFFGQWQNGRISEWSFSRREVFGREGRRRHQARAAAHHAARVVRQRFFALHRRQCTRIVGVRKLFPSWRFHGKHSRNDDACQRSDIARMYRFFRYRTISRRLRATGSFLVFGTGSFFDHRQSARPRHIRRIFRSRQRLGVIPECN